ncbi:hypothetical protein BMS3Abin03_01685 [bacterium BMS3Abin03]|nr:hypothetical protein BMS3Abin03_01685 [bacterium BMS3Abin03]
MSEFLIIRANRFFAKMFIKKIVIEWIYDCVENRINI